MELLEGENVAARLQQLAPPNAIYIGQQTYDRVRGLFKTKDLGEMSLKGKAQKINVYLVHHGAGDPGQDLIIPHLNPPDLKC